VIPKELIQVLRCSNSLCQNKLEPSRGSLKLVEPKYRRRMVYSGTLKCLSCGEEYPIKYGVPNLLPKRIRNDLKGKTRQVLSQPETEVVSGIKWSEKMVPSYHENVVDPYSSAFGARFIERYEDLCIDNVLNSYLKKGMKVVFIEMGVGTGRYLIRFGSRILNSSISHKSRVAWQYRKDRTLNRYYSFDEDYDKNLQLLVGIDYQEGMIRKCKENLRGMKLRSLIGERIMLLVGSAQYLHLAFDQIDRFRDSFKVVTCVFQTLGNQTEASQILLLKTLKGLATPRGKIFVSVFNKQRFSDFGLGAFYKYEVAPTVGRIRDDAPALKMRKKGILLTDRGVYSQWFSEEDLRRRFETSGLSAVIKSNEKLPTFGEHTDYIDEEMQNQVRKTLITAESEVVKQGL
jgi:uncharacterized protein YbaR (Trm112 family)